MWQYQCKHQANEFLHTKWRFTFLSKLSRVIAITIGKNYYSLNFHSCLHIGHCCCAWVFNHFIMQCIWKQCEHWPQTKGQSSPGNLQSEQHASKGIRQIPHESSLATQCHAATARQLLTRTFRPVPLFDASGDCIANLESFSSEFVSRNRDVIVHDSQLTSSVSGRMRSSVTGRLLLSLLFLKLTLSCRLFQFSNRRS